MTTDANGNTTRTEGTPSVSPEFDTTATYDNLNQLTQLNEASVISNFTYDNNGNLEEIKKNGTRINMRWFNKSGEKTVFGRILSTRKIY